MSPFGKRTSSSNGALMRISADPTAWLYYASELDQSIFTLDLKAISHHSVGHGLRMQAYFAVFRPLQSERETDELNYAEIPSLYLI